MRSLQFFFSVIVLACGVAHAEPIPVDMQRILDKGTLVIAMYGEDVPPFFMHDASGAFTGFEVDMAHDIASRLGVTVEFDRSARTFDELVDIVLERKADIAVSMMSNTLTRAMRVRFTDPYITLRQSLLINRLRYARVKGNQPDIAHILNTPGIEIGVIDGTSYVAFARKDYPNARIVTYKDWDSVVSDVLKGALFAVLYDEIEIRNWHTSNPDGALYVQTIIMEDKKDPIAIAVNPLDEQLLSWLNLYLQKILSDGTKTTLMNTYFQTDEWVGN